MDTSEFEYLKGNFHVIVVDVLTILNVNCICRGKNGPLHPIQAAQNDDFLLAVRFRQVKVSQSQQSRRDNVFSLGNTDLPGSSS